MSDPVSDVVRALTAPLCPLDETVAALAREPGLVAWWGDAGLVDGTQHPDDDRWVLWTVGDATMLRNRVTRQDLYRTGVSELRRVLAGFLLDELALAPTWAAEVVLPKADEDRLTTWMRAHARLSWTARADRKECLPGVVATLDPALHLDHDPARAAHERYIAVAGERPERQVGVPFRRP